MSRGIMLAVVMFFVNLVLVMSIQANDAIVNLIMAQSLIGLAEDYSTRPKSKFEERLKKWRRGLEYDFERVEREFGSFVRKVSKNTGVDYNLILAVILVESRGDVNLCSVSNACGLMQVKVEAAQEVGVYGSLFDPEINILAGAKYLVSLCDRYGFCDVGWQLIAYNMGPGGAKKYREKGKRPIDNYYVARVDDILEKRKNHQKKLVKTVARIPLVLPKSRDEHRKRISWKVVVKLIGRSKR